MENKKICKYYLSGYCKYGKTCHYIHPDNQNIMIDEEPAKPISNKSGKTCSFFLDNKCNRENCHYFHGYCDILKHIKTIQNDSDINNLVKIDDTRFLLSDEQKIYAKDLQNNKDIPIYQDDNSRIGKVVVSSNKVIFAIQKGE